MSQQLPAADGRLRLVLHLGMRKTGTSALQVEFVRHREALAALGITYPEHPSDATARTGGVTSGNGVALLPFLAPRFLPEREPANGAQFLDQLVRREAPLTLHSSEYLYYADIQLLEAFVQRADAAGVVVQAVVFVRDVAGYLLSAYAQDVKRHLYTKSFADYLGDEAASPYRLVLEPQLAALIRVLGRENLAVRHYDSARGRVLEECLSALVAAPDIADWERTPGDVNRSLSGHETLIMRYVNARLAREQQGSFVSTALVARPPLRPEPVGITEAEVAVLDERFGKDVDWINAEFFGTPLMSVRGDVTAAPHRNETLAAEETYLLDCIAEMFAAKPEV